MQLCGEGKKSSSSIRGFSDSCSRRTQRNRHGEEVKAAEGSGNLTARRGTDILGV